VTYKYVDSDWNLDLVASLINTTDYNQEWRLLGCYSVWIL
jgi:hypothetical protein